VEGILAEVRVVGSHLGGDRRPTHGQLGDLTLPARLALVTITRVRTENQSVLRCVALGLRSARRSDPTKLWH